MFHQRTVEVKFTIEQAIKAQTEGTGIALLCPNLGTRWGWVVNATPRLLTAKKRPGIHCTGGLVGPSAGVDPSRKSQHHWDLIPGPPSP
jgi:hypothetical protein